MEKISIRAVLFATLVFVVLYSSFVAVTSLVATNYPEVVGGRVWMVLGPLFLVFLVLVGFLAARLAGSAGVLNGAAVGVIAALISLSGPWLFFEWDISAFDYLIQYTLAYLVMGILPCSLGGLAWEFTRKFRL